jgi:acetyltransferase-like isoleucine patch superfamily enzyme
MKSFKQMLKKIPFVSSLLQRTNKRILSPDTVIKGSNNKIINEGRFNNVVFDAIGDNNMIQVGKNSSVNNTLIYIRGNYHRIIIEENCYYGEGELWLEDDHCSLIIHSNTTVERGHLAATESYSSIEIQKDCMLARFVEIRTGDSHSIIDNTTGERINKAADVTLEEHVWVGAHAKILKGVTVGHNSIVGTGAVVAKNIPANSIVGGIPAKVLRSNVDWLRERI